MSDACPTDKPFCVNTQGSYTCLEMTGVRSCPAGFKFDKSLQQCKGNSYNISHLSLSIFIIKQNFSCVLFCLFFFFTRRSDVDECAENIHSCLTDVEQCRNIEGAYECDMKCEKGFTYNIGLGACVGECSHRLYSICARNDSMMSILFPIE